MLELPLEQNGEHQTGTQLKGGAVAGGRPPHLGGRKEAEAEGSVKAQRRQPAKWQAVQLPWLRFIWRLILPSSNAAEPSNWSHGALAS